MSLYLCVDCGGSKTSAVICSASGEVLGRALGGPSNFAYLGLQAFTDAVRIAVSDALKTCTSPPSVSPVPLPPQELQIARAWLGVSGIDSPAAAARASAEVSKILGVPEGPRLVVCNDTHLLAAPLSAPKHRGVRYAITAIAGTGSCVAAFKAAEAGGEEEGAPLKELGRHGGWGWILGDEGGGFHVGREAVRAVMLAADRASVRPASASARPSALTTRLLDHFGVQDPYELLTAVHLPDPAPLTSSPLSAALTIGGAEAAPTPAHALLAREARLSKLSPLVFAAAFEDGDPLALSVLEFTAQSLAEQIGVLLVPVRVPVTMRPAPEGAEPEPVVIKPDGGEPVTLMPTHPSEHPLKDPGASDGIVGKGEHDVEEASSRAVKAKDAILCFGGSLAGVEKYRQMVVDALAKNGHVFRDVEFVSDAALAGARGLASTAR